MVSEDSTVDVPAFKFDPSTLAKIREKLNVPDDEVPPENAEPFVQQEPIIRIKRKRRPGRPSKQDKENERRAELGLPPIEEVVVAADTPLPPAKLTKRDEKEVSERLVNILMGGTGIAGQAKSYLAMTDEEAKAIADPLSSYLVRNADTLPIAGQILENYDLLAITLGVMAYVVRIYRDRTIEIAEQRAANPNPKRTISDFVAEHTNPNNNGQAEGSNDILTSPYG